MLRVGHDATRTMQHIPVQAVFWKLSRNLLLATQMISEMFRELRESTLTRTVSKITGLYVTLKPRTPTVAASFHESLLNLIDTMSR